MNVSKLLAINGNKYPDKEALICGEQRLTYRQWNEAANHLARLLEQRGVQPGDKIVLMMPNVPEFAILYFAIIRAGGIVVPINPRFSHDEAAYILDDCQAKALFVHEAVYPAVRRLAANADGRLYVKTGPAEGAWESLDDWKNTAVTEGPAFDHWALTEDDEVDILYTSGTTGRPKGVRFTHRNLLAVSTMIAVEFECNTDSRILHMMPLSHSAPLHLMFIAGVVVGAAHVFHPTFAPDIFLKLAEQERITHFFGAPVAYLLSMQLPDFDRRDLSAAKYWIYGGAPLSKLQADAIAEKFGKDKLVCVYGLTEAGPSGTLLRHRDHHHKSGSIGNRAALFTEIEIVDEQGRLCAPGQVGEIRLRGEGTMIGYLNRPEETALTIRDGWVYTGDLAYRDEDGFFWIVDRKKDVIISGGVNIYPKEVEDALIAHPDIQEVAVVGVPHEVWGETVKAFIVLKPGTPERDEAAWLKQIREFLTGKLADYKMPRLVTTLEQLPRNANGKILKHQLKDLS